MMKKSSLLIAMGAILSVALITSPVSAVTYDVDPSLSYLSFTARVDPGTGPVDLAPQDGDPQAMITALDGTIEANANGGALIELVEVSGLGTSIVDAQLNPIAAAGAGLGTSGEFLPNEGDALPVGDDDLSPFGIYNTGVDNFGVELDLGFFGVAYGAIRNFSLTAEGSAVPGVGTGTGIGFNILDGIFAFDGGALGQGEEGLDTTADPAAYNTGGDVGYSLVGAIETITLPIEIVETDYTLSGVIVASRVIPEPATLALFGMGLCATLMVRRRPASPSLQ